ncbi:MAG: hypothetical protein M3Z09_11230, partial [Acidobacteriota bacterium]|nr:hypothetical protein [Acidobacteriota bacterium]
VFDSLTRCRGSVAKVPGWAVYNDSSGIESGPGNHFNAFAFLLPPDDFGSYAFLNDPSAVPYITRIAQGETIGFQVVSTAPEPGTFVLLGTTLTVAGCCFSSMKRPRL